MGRTHGMVDFSEDVSSADIHTAVGEGYDSVELLKRYTTVTMGPAQGKLETVNAVAVLAEATGRTIAETGTTTWRPMHVPITLGAFAGRIHEPVRVLAVAAVAPAARGAAAGGRAVDPARSLRGSGRRGAGRPGGRRHHRCDPDRKAGPAWAGRPEAARPALRQQVLDAAGRAGALRRDVRRGRRGARRRGHRAARPGPLADVDDVVGCGHRLGVGGELAADRAYPETSTQWRVHVTPLTTALASINVAGPRSRELVGRLAEGVDLSDEAFGYMNVRAGRLAGIDGCVLWRIGFTGELSYELHVPAGFGLHVWEALLGHGSDLGVAPFGMEAQRILRLEKGHAIVGQDTDGLTKAYSAGLAALVKLDKDDFVGRPELVWQHEAGTGPRLVGLQPVDGSEVPPEASQIVAARGSDGGSPIIGRVTSSRMSPTLHRSVCLAQLDAAHAAAGTQVDVQLPDGRRIAAHVMSQLAHFDPEGHRLRAGSAAPVGPVRPTSTPVAISAVTLAPGHRRISGAESGLTLADLGSLAKISIRAPQDGVAAAALGTGFGRAVRSAHGELVVGSGPGEWLVLGDPGTQDALSTRLQDFGSSDEFVSVVDLTHGRALLRLRGWHSADLLGKVCAMDLSDDAAPDGAALRTSVAHVVTDLIRDDQGARPLTCCIASAVRGSTSSTRCSTPAPNSVSGASPTPPSPPSPSEGDRYARARPLPHHRRRHPRPVHGVAPGPSAAGHRCRRRPRRAGAGQVRRGGGSVRRRLRGGAQQLLPAGDARTHGALRRRLGVRPGRVRLPRGRLPADRPGGDASRRRADLRRAAALSVTPPSSWSATPPVART